MITLGVAARLAEEKGFEYLFEAMNIIGLHVRLWGAGSIDPVGEEKYKNIIMNLVSKMGDRVKFLGNLDQVELKNFYRDIDILVVPSINSTEAFGIVQVEAMMQDTPVVASNLPGVRVPILKTGMGELCEPENPESIAKAIIKVAKTKYENTAKNLFVPKLSYEKYRSVILS